MRWSLRPAPLVGALAALLMALLLAAPTGASAQPIKGKPKIADIEGFAYPTDFSLEHWRAGAVLITRYPKVLPSDFPGRIRKLLSFRAIGKLAVKDHGNRIASRRDRGGLPVAVEGRSVYYAHLLVFTLKQSERIFHSLGLRKSARGWPAAGNVRTKASAQVRVKAKGRTIAHSGAKSAQAVTLAGERYAPWVVNGCVIEPYTECRYADLSGAKLFRANLFGASFGYANLSNAELDQATLGGASFPRANLTRASLVSANLEEANLTEANLTAADLRSAGLEDANLRGADVSGANLSGARFCRTTMPDGSLNNSGC